MSNKSEEEPEWFTRGRELLWPILVLAYEKSREIDDEFRRVPVECAALHLLNTMRTSVDANRKGRHSVALALMRQCTEAVTIVELGLIDEPASGDLIADWKGEAEHGEIRRKLQSQVWEDYDTGLWNETWAEYFGNLAQAVNPYAHYSPELQGWQMVVPDHMPLVESKDGLLKGFMKYGPDTYDKNKATRITLLHILIGWTVGRLILENGEDDRLDDDDVNLLGNALAHSDPLGGGKLNWDKQFWANEFWGAEESG